MAAIIQSIGRFARKRQRLASLVQSQLNLQPVAEHFASLSPKQFVYSESFHKSSDQVNANGRRIHSIEESLAAVWAFLCLKLNRECCEDSERISRMNYRGHLTVIYQNRTTTHRQEDSRPNSSVQTQESNRKIFCEEGGELYYSQKNNSFAAINLRFEGKTKFRISFYSTFCVRLIIINAGLWRGQRIQVVTTTLLSLL